MADEIIESRANPALKRLRRVKEKGGGMLVLEGPKLVEEALAAGVSVVEAAVTPRGAARPGVAAILAALAGRGAVVRRVAEDVLASLSELETSQGLLAVAERPAVDEGRIFTGRPLVLVAAGVQNPGNVGALVRTAEAAGATGAYLAEGSADPFSWKALRGAMGSAFRLPIVAGLSADEALARVRARGLRIVAASASGDTEYEQAELAVPAAILVGNEGSGLAPAWERAADVRVRIPMAPPVESLNVGIAAALLLFEAARQRRKAR
jgi:TrmH family RNA methyltransferase